MNQAEVTHVINTVCEFAGFNGDGDIKLHRDGTLEIMLPRHTQPDLIALERALGMTAYQVGNNIIVEMGSVPKQSTSKIITRAQYQPVTAQPQPEQSTPQSPLYTGDRVVFGQPEPGFWGKLFGRGQ